MYIIGKRKTYVNRFFLVPPSLVNFSFICIVNPLMHNVPKWSDTIYALKVSDIGKTNFISNIRERTQETDSV